MAAPSARVVEDEKNFRKWGRTTLPNGETREDDAIGAQTPKGLAELRWRTVTTPRARAHGRLVIAFVSIVPAVAIIPFAVVLAVDLAMSLALSLALGAGLGLIGLVFGRKRLATGESWIILPADYGDARALEITLREACASAGIAFPVGMGPKAGGGVPSWRIDGRIDLFAWPPSVTVGGRPRLGVMTWNPAADDTYRRLKGHILEAAKRHTPEIREAPAETADGQPPAPRAL